jgi:hypothetical protein
MNDADRVLKAVVSKLRIKQLQLLISLDEHKSLRKAPAWSPTPWGVAPFDMPRSFRRSSFISAARCRTSGPGPAAVWSGTTTAVVQLLIDAARNHTLGGSR